MAGDLQAQAADAPDEAFEGALIELRAHLERRDFETAARAEAAAQRLASAALSPDAPCRAWLAQGTVSLALGQIDGLWRAVDRVAEHLRLHPPGGPVLRYEHFRALSHAHMASAHQAQAVDVAEAALAAAHECGAPLAVAAALGNLAGRLYALGFQQARAEGLPTACAALERSVAVGDLACAQADALGSRLLNLSNLNNLAGAWVVLGDRARAMATFERLDALAEATGLHWTRVMSVTHRARLLNADGDADGALALVAQALPQAQTLRATKALALLHLVASEVHESQGRFELALRAFKAFHDDERLDVDERAEAVARVMAVRESAHRGQQEAAALREANVALTRQALTDPLTGLANRRACDEALERMTQPASAGGCLVLIDADHFKAVNDRHSHAVGDAVLRELARLMRQCCREGDLAARWGGEEFALLLAGTPLPMAQRACERLRRTVQAHDWAALAQGLSVTVSIGIAAVMPGEPMAAALERCDAALYRSKREGRNRVSAFDGTPG